MHSKITRKDITRSWWHTNQTKKLQLTTKQFLLQIYTTTLLMKVHCEVVFCPERRLWVATHSTIILIMIPSQPTWRSAGFMTSIVLFFGGGDQSTRISSPPPRPPTPVLSLITVLQLLSSSLRRPENMPRPRTSWSAKPIESSSVGSPKYCIFMLFSMAVTVMASPLQHCSYAAKATTPWSSLWSLEVPLNLDMTKYWRWRRCFVFMIFARRDGNTSRNPVFEGFQMSNQDD